MKCRLSLVTAITVIVIGVVLGDGLLTEKRGKYLRHNGFQDFGKNQIQRILNRWNSSIADDRADGLRWSGGSDSGESEEPARETKTGRNPHDNDLVAFGGRFSSAFKGCIFSRKKEIVRSVPRGKDIIFGCFRDELVGELQDMTEEYGSVSLLKGYVQLEKVDEPKSLRGGNSSGGSGPDAGGVSVRRRGRSGRRRGEEGTEPGEGYVRSNDTAEEREVYARYSEELINDIRDDLVSGSERGRSAEDSRSVAGLTQFLSDLTRKYALRFTIFPGVSARMKRAKSSGMTFDLELEDVGLGGGGDDDDEGEEASKKDSEKDDGDDDDDEDEEDEEGNEDEEEDEEEEDEDDDNDLRKGKGKHKKKPKSKLGKKGGKKKLKLLKKLGPYLVIPMLIQALMLPLAFKFLLFFAIKALLAGKVALLLVAMNLIKNAQYKSDEDEYVERVGKEHYGYGNGEEYGAWINRRSIQEDEDSTADDPHPYRGYAAERK